MAKVYLSSAAHQHDNPTKCGGGCSENTHCREYMNKLQARLRELGFDVKRGFAEQTGEPAMKNRVAEANAWGADLYYVAHTNAGGGRYSMTLCWSDAASKKKAAVIGKYRKWPHGHKVKARTDLYEIKMTKMTTLYDELFFHDNADDCAAFHGGWMERMVEETAQALCELLGVPYKTPSADSDERIKALEERAAQYQKEIESLKNTIVVLNNKIENAKNALM
jgi:N-acetylmuramoyl-L-alanine amidase